jgi:putative ABC transport system substrate-binding protein
MRRRGFLGGAATALVWPRAAFGGVRRLGVLTTPAEDDPIFKQRAAALTEGLAAHGWNEGDNLRIDWRTSGRDPSLLARYAEDLVSLAPDVLLAIGSPCAEQLRRRTNKIPIVFTIVTDPISQGFVASLSRPGGNMTGFTDFDPSMAGKWLEMLTEIAPPVRTVAVFYNPSTAPFAEAMLKIVGDAASRLGIVVERARASDQAGIGAAIATISKEDRAGLLVVPDIFAVVNRAAIVDAAARARVSAVYPYQVFAREGGLMSYGTDNNDLHRRPAAYIDRILKGADPGELPVQNPTRFSLVLNMKTAGALAIEIPPTLLAAADEVIE